MNRVGMSDPVHRRRAYTENLKALKGQVLGRAFDARHANDVPVRLPVVGAVGGTVDGTAPRVRVECAPGAGVGRPCPWVSCRHHLYVEVSETLGSVKYVHPGREVAELEQTCSLDVADEGGATLERVGALLNITRERVRQIEVRALLKVRRRIELLSKNAVRGL